MTPLPTLAHRLSAWPWRILLPGVGSALHCHAVTLELAQRRNADLRDELIRTMAERDCLKAMHERRAKDDAADKAEAQDWFRCQNTAKEHALVTGLVVEMPLRVRRPMAIREAVF